MVSVDGNAFPLASLTFDDSGNPRRPYQIEKPREGKGRASDVIFVLEHAAHLEPLLNAMHCLR